MLALPPDELMSASPCGGFRFLELLARAVVSVGGAVWEPGMVVGKRGLGLGCWDGESLVWLRESGFRRLAFFICGHASLPLGCAGFGGAGASGLSGGFGAA